MTYDQWKCTDPRDYDPEDECLCEDAELDWAGLFHCAGCGMVWRASAADIAHAREQAAEYDAWCRKQERREFLRRLTWPIRWPIFRLLERVWPRKALRVLTDDEIPF